MKKKKPKKLGRKSIEPFCKNCLCYDGEKGICKVVVLINGKRFNMPVFPNDRCHMDALNIPVEQVRWWSEDKLGQRCEDGKGTVKIEYPDGFFTESGIDLPNYFSAGPEDPPLPPEPAADKP